MWTPAGLLPVRPLGRGGGASVTLCEEAGTGLAVSLKVAEGDPELRSALAREHATLTGIDFPGLPRALASGSDDTRTWYTYEHVPGLSLRELGTATDREAFDGVARGLLGSLLVLHGLGWVHYDVSPDNVLVDDPRDWRTVTLIDFGHAGPPGRTLLGTPGWMAPELVRGEPGGPESDLFSAGLVLVEYALGERLVAERGEREGRAAGGGSIEVPRDRLVAAVGEERADVLRRLVEPERRDRLGDVFEAIHAFGGDEVVRTALASLVRAVLPEPPADRDGLAEALLRLRFETGSADALADRAWREAATGRLDLARLLGGLLERGALLRRAGGFLLCRLNDEWLADGMDPVGVEAALAPLAPEVRADVAALAAAAEFGSTRAVARLSRRLDRLTGALSGLLREEPDGLVFDPPALAILVRRAESAEDLDRARRRAADRLERDAEESSASAALFLRLLAGEPVEIEASRRLLRLAETGRFREADRLLYALEVNRAGKGLPEELAVAAAFVRIEEREWGEARRLLARIDGPGPVAALLVEACALEIEGSLPPDRPGAVSGTGGDRALGRYEIEVRAAILAGEPPAARDVIAEAVRRTGSAADPGADPGAAVATFREIGRRGSPLLRFSLLGLVNTAGRLLFEAGEREEAKSLFRAASGLAADWRMTGRRSVIEGNLANCLIHEGELEEAAELLERIARDREERGDTRGAVTARGNLGVVRYDRRETEEALSNWERQAALIRESGPERKLASVRCRIACALQETGAWAPAKRAFESAVALAMGYGDLETELRSRVNHASLLLEEGCVAAAARELQAARAVAAGREGAAGWRPLLDYVSARIQLEDGRPAFAADDVLAVLESGGEHEPDAHPHLDRQDRLELAARSAILLGVGGDLRPALAAAEIDEDVRPRFDLLGLRSVVGGATPGEIAELAALLPGEVVGSETAERAALFAEALVELESVQKRSPGQLAEKLAEVAWRSGLPGLIWRAHLVTGLKSLRRGLPAEAVRELGRALRGFRRCVGAGDASFSTELRSRAELRALERAIGELRPSGAGAADADADGAGFEPEAALTDAALAMAERGEGGDRRWERRIERVLAVTKTLNSTRRLDPLLSFIVESVLDLCDAEHGFLVLIDETGAPTVRVARGALGETGEEPRNFVSRTVLDRVLTERRSVLIRNALDEEGLVDKPSVQRLSLQSVMGAPLLVHDRLLGAVLADNRTATGCFGPDDLRLLEVFASQAAIAIENRRLFDDLEASYRSLEEAQERIVRVEKLKSLGVLAGGIAHDFNNLLTSILGNADMALRNLGSDSPAERRIEEVKNAALLAADLCSQLLAYSGKGHTVVDTIDLSGLVRRVAELMKVSVPRSVTIDYDLADGLPGVEADATQLRQVFLNLLTNAVEACGARYGRVAVRTGIMDCDADFLAGAHVAENAAPGPRVFLEVADTGVGMSEEAKARLFEPFYTTKFTGRGLGLSAVLGIVRGHGGTIRVESEPGAGTRITVLFPPAGAVAAAPETPASGAGEWRGSGRVLVVDDEEFVLEVAGEMLKELGLEPIPARDGFEALEIFRRRGDGIGAVLLDMNMPGMNGSEVFEELRRIRGDLPIVISSGYSETDMTKAFAGRRVDAFMSKPYEFAKLVETFRAVFG